MNFSHWLIPPLALGAPLLAQSEEEARPNILVIQCDDLGWDDIGCNNPLVHTPNIDRLASESVTFSNFTVNPVCAPSRATFLTGREFLRTGVSHVHGGKDFLHLDERTIADHLRSAGYTTGLWGKWHSGDAEGYYPWQRGFDEAFMAQLYRHRDPRGRLNGKPVEHAGWADAVMADYAIDFMRRHRAGPFFAYLPTMTPHGPHDAPEQWVKHYTARGISPALAKLWGMVSFLDEQLGRVFTAMEEPGLSSNTIVVFMSDNGPAIESAALSDEDRHARRISGLRGWKGDLYENAVRSPLFIRWPGRISPQDIAKPLDLSDLAPTLLALADVEIAAGTPPMDGRSFAGLLKDPDAHAAPKRIFNYAHRGWLTSGPAYSVDGIPGEYAPVSRSEKKDMEFDRQSLSVREGDFKLVLNPDFLSGGPDGTSRLFNLRTDPGETSDISPREPDVRDRLLSAVKEWWNTIRQEPHAFGTPVFQVVNGSADIPANAPFRMQGSIVNTVPGIKGWSSPGDGVTYALHLTTATACELTLKWNAAMREDTLWQVKATGMDKPHVISATESPEIRLPAGDSQLEISLASGPLDEASPILKRIILTPSK